MTLRPLPRSRLDRILPPLLREQALVVLVPVTEGGDERWAAEAAWDVARVAAVGGRGDRRAVALVDLCLESPRLHQEKGIAAAPGIADVFASDAPLSDVAHDIGGVYFLPAGGEAMDPATVRGSSRWARLQAGFASEGALLLLYVPADRLAELGAVPDGVLALAPTGVDLGSPAGRALLGTRDRGVELLGAVRERWSAPQSQPYLAVRPLRVRPVAAALGAAIAIASVALFATAKESFRPAAREPTRASGRDSSRSTAGVAALTRDAAPVTGRSIPVLPAADSITWTLQLAAYGAPDRALTHADRLAAAGLPAFVSPTTPDASGAVWYRVQAGAFATREAATAAREAYRRRGLLDAREGQPLRAPYSLVLADRADGPRLRAAGFAAVCWGNRGPVLVGAFENPEQAGVALAQLRGAGFPATLLIRTERTP